MVRALLAFAALAGAASPATGQTISGTVRETDGGPLIPGAFISLLGGSGEAVRADFTAPGGTFGLTAPVPGRYRLRVERIGYATWTTEPYELSAGHVLSVTVEVPPRPVRLRDLRVDVTGSCFDDPSQGRALATVWEELRKALATAVWAEERGDLRFNFTRWERILEPRTLTVREATSRTYLRQPLPPFRSVPVAELTRSGFVVVTEEASEYRAPDANVLLSREFRTGHCFGLTRATVGGAPKLGITFRPRERRRVPQIEGTLWLDEENAHLDRAELSYRNLSLPRRVDRRLIGAEIVFDRLPDGPFYVRNWWIRFPFFEGGSFTGYLQGGGSVKRASGRDAAWEMGHAVALGIVRDSVSREPLAGAQVILRPWEDAAAFVPPPDPAETPFSATTDRDGRFLVGGLPDGAYALSVDHSKLRTAGFRLNETRVVVEELFPRETEIWTPSAETLYARICREASPAEGEGAVVGTARDATTGRPIPGILIEALWSVRVRRGVARAVSESAVSDGQGRFAICRVTLGETIQLRTPDDGGVAEFEQDARVVWQDVTVEP